MDIVALVLEGQGSWVTGRKKKKHDKKKLRGRLLGISPDASDVPDEQGEIMEIVCLDFFSQNIGADSSVRSFNLSFLGSVTVLIFGMVTS